VSHGRSKYISVVDLITFEVERKIETKGGPNGIAVVPFSKLLQTYNKLTCLPLTVSVPTVGNPQGRTRNITRLQFWQERTVMLVF
jgi:hypothetical protein